VPAESDTRLVDAAEQNHLATVDTLLEADVDVNTPQVDGMTTLHWAVYHDNLALTRRLVVAGALAQATSRYGVTPVSLACQNGSGKIVRLLLESGEDSGTRMRGGETALMIAARTGKVEPIDALLAHRADVNATEARG
jgi:ankyrin repeat protein